MSNRLARCVPVFALALAASTLARAEDPPAGKDAAGAPLPKGAKLRIGNTHLVFPPPTLSPPYGLFAPDFKTFVQLRDGGPLPRLDAATGKPVGKFTDSDKSVRRAGQQAASANGERLATLVSGGVSVRSIQTGELVKELKAPAGAFLDSMSALNYPTVSISADGKTVAAGIATAKGGKGELVVWDVGKGEIAFQTETLQTAAPSVVLSPDGRLVAARGPLKASSAVRPPETGLEIQVWDVAEKKEVLKAKPTTGSYVPISMAFSADGATFASAFGDGSIDLWDVKTGKRYEPLLGRTGQGFRMIFSPDGNTLAAVSTGGAIERWTVADGKRLGTTEPPVAAAEYTLAIHGIAFADNTRVVAWGRHTTCPVAWEAPSGKLITQVPELTAPAGGMAFAPGGKELLTTMQGGSVLRWDVATGKLLGQIKLNFPRGVSREAGLGLSADGTRAATFSPFATVVFDLTTSLEDFALPRLTRGTTAFRPSPDLKRACMLTWGEPAAPVQCVVWDLVARRRIADLAINQVSGFGHSAALSPSGERLATVLRPITPVGAKSARESVVGWDVKTGKKLGQVDDEVTGYGSLALAVADEKTAVVRYPTGRLRVLDYEAGKFGAEIEPDPKKTEPVPGYGAVVFSPDRKTFASVMPPGEGEWPHGVRLYEWPSGKPLRTLAGHTAPVSAFAFAPDGKTLATASNDSTIVIWDLTADK